MSWFFVSKKEFEQLQKENAELVKQYQMLPVLPGGKQRSEARKQALFWPLVSKRRFERLRRENEDLAKACKELRELSARIFKVSSPIFTTSPIPMGYRSRNDSDAAMC